MAASTEPRVLHARQRLAATQNRGMLAHRRSVELHCRIAARAGDRGNLAAERNALERASRAAARLDALPRPPTLGIGDDTQLALLLAAVTETADEFDRSGRPDLAEHLRILRQLQLDVLLDLRLCGESLLN